MSLYQPSDSRDDRLLPEQETPDALPMEEGEETLDLSLEACVPEEADTFSLADDLDAIVRSMDRDMPLPANCISVPAELMNQTGYVGPVWGFLRQDSGYHSILGWAGREPNPFLKTECIGAIGREPDPETETAVCGLSLQGVWTENGLELRTLPEGTPLRIFPYTLRQDIFSRNSGLIETSWMDGKCAALNSCGPVGGTAALQLARSGVGRFLLASPETVQLKDITRLACNLTDLGRFQVDVIAERVQRINPDIRVRVFHCPLQDVPREAYADWMGADKALFVGATSDWEDNVALCDLARSFSTPFVALDFQSRAWAGNVFAFLPERNDRPYQEVFPQPPQGAGEDNPQIGPGLDMDLTFGTSLLNKVALDILNRDHAAGHFRLLHRMGQSCAFRGTDDLTFASEGWKAALPYPICVSLGEAPVA